MNRFQRRFHPNAIDHAFHSSAHVSLSETENMRRNKENLQKYRKLRKNSMHFIGLIM